MKVLLVRPLLLNPATATGAMDSEPLELEYLYTACKAAGIEAPIYDGITEHRKFSAVLLAERPDVVAVTGYITQENVMGRYASLVRRFLPGCPVIFGGVHAQLNFERLYFPQTDFVLRAEDPTVFVALLLEIFGSKDFCKINGLCWRENGSFRTNPYVPGDVTALPIPERPVLKERGERFRYLDLSGAALLKTSVSCPYCCDFCYGRNLHGGKYQARSPEQVADELEVLEADTVFIVDSDFLFDAGRLLGLVRLLRERSICKKYVCYGRADFIAAHPELIRELVSVGFAYFLVGIEGSNDRVLDSYHKQSDVNANEGCITLLHDCGAECVALMIADLSFGRKDFSSLYRWAKVRPLRYVSVQIYTPIPPTEPYRRMNDRLLTKDPVQWDLAHAVVKPDQLSRSAFHFWYRLLLVRLFLLGRFRGAYRFITPRYLLQAAANYLRRLFTTR